MQPAECSIDPLLTKPERKFVSWCLQRRAPTWSLVALFVSAIGTSATLAVTAFNFHSPSLSAVEHLALYCFMGVLLLLAGGVTSSASEVIRKYEAFLAEVANRQSPAEQRDG